MMSELGKVRKPYLFVSFRGRHGNFSWFDGQDREMTNIKQLMIILIFLQIKDKIWSVNRNILFFDGQGLLLTLFSLRAFLVVKIITDVSLSLETV